MLLQAALEAEQEAVQAQRGGRGRAAADEEATPVSDDTIAFAAQHAPTLVAMLRHGQKMARLRQERGARAQRLMPGRLSEARAGGGGIGATSLSAPLSAYGDGFGWRTSGEEEDGSKASDGQLTAHGPGPEAYRPEAEEARRRAVLAAARERWEDPLRGGRPPLHRPADVGQAARAARVQGVTASGTADSAAPLVWWRMQGGASTGRPVDQEVLKRRADAHAAGLEADGARFRSPRDVMVPVAEGSVVPPDRLFAAEHSRTAFLLRPSVPVDLRGVPAPAAVEAEGRAAREAQRAALVYKAGQRPPHGLGDAEAEAAQTAAGWGLLRAGAAPPPGADAAGGRPVTMAAMLRSSDVSGRRTYPRATATSADREISRRAKLELSPRSNLGEADSAHSPTALSVASKGDEEAAEWRASRRMTVHRLLVAGADGGPSPRPGATPGLGVRAGRPLSRETSLLGPESRPGSASAPSLPSALRRPRPASPKSAELLVDRLPPQLRPTTAQPGLVAGAGSALPASGKHKRGVGLRGAAVVMDGHEPAPQQRPSRTKPLVSEVRGLPRPGTRPGAPLPTSGLVNFGARVVESGSHPAGEGRGGVPRGAQSSGGAMFVPRAAPRLAGARNRATFAL